MADKRPLKDDDLKKIAGAGIGPAPDAPDPDCVDLPGERGIKRPINPPETDDDTTTGNDTGLPSDLNH